MILSHHSLVYSTAPTELTKNLIMALQIQNTFVLLSIVKPTGLNTGSDTKEEKQILIQT